jgi:hypothetical protein
MKPRHAAALALVGWYWMVPPTYIYPIHGNVLDPNNRVVVNLNAPLTWRFNWGEYDSRSACEAKRANNIQEDTTLEKDLKTKPSNELEEFVEMDRHSLCVATDDPRLKEAK